MRKAIFTVLIITFLLTGKIAASEERTLNYAPLPMMKFETVIKQHKPLLDYLQRSTGYKFNIVYSLRYEEILEKFRNGSIDLAYLGPLPYVIFKEKFDAIVPLARFIVNSKGDDTYTCAIVVRADSNIKSMKDFGSVKKMALTQVYSTCGYLAPEALLREKGFSLEKINYDFTGSHDKVILSVINGDYDAGSVEIRVAEKYLPLGIKIIGETIDLPGFAIIANSKTLSKEQMNRLKSALIKLQPRKEPEIKKLTDTWDTAFKYGAIASENSDYNVIRDLLKHIKLPIEKCQR